jgi:hypothetical protein
MPRWRDRAAGSPHDGGAETQEHFPSGIDRFACEAEPSASRCCSLLFASGKELSIAEVTRARDA